MSKPVKRQVALSATAKAVTTPSRPAKISGKSEDAQAGSLHQAPDPQDGADRANNDQRCKGSATITIPWRKTPSRRPREIIMPEGSSDHRPARAETNRKLIASIACGRRWLQEIRSGAATIEAIAGREGCSARRVDMTVQLAFLSPFLVKAAVEGRLPRGIGVSRLFNLPPEWAQQHRMLGLPMV